MLRIWEMKFEKFERFSKKMGTLGPRLSHKFCSQTRQSSKRMQQPKKSFLFKWWGGWNLGKPADVILEWSLSVTRPDKRQFALMGAISCASYISFTSKNFVLTGHMDLAHNLFHTKLRDFFKLRYFFKQIKHYLDISLSEFNQTEYQFLEDIWIYFRFFIFLHNIIQFYLLLCLFLMW